ncbi:MAG: hypothetical protein NUV75_12835 [Gallionella sp.]|nr:hypothetical protein [Gallionella sp.]
MKTPALPVAIVLAVLSLPALAIPMQGRVAVSYKNDVLPIINDYCLSCHKPGGKGYEKSGLDMRSYESLMKGTRFGSVIKPGDSFTSVIIQAVEGRLHPSIKMPYGIDGGLSRDKIKLFKEWVQQGAKNN